MPRFLSSLVDSQCHTFAQKHPTHSLTHSHSHSHTGISQTHTRSLLLSDPMNDRSKDCAPRGTLRGSWGSWTATLSHTVGTRHQLVVVQGFFYVLHRRYHADRFRCALGLLCSHAPTERVPGLNACPCRVWGWGGIGRENSRGDITKRPITPAPADPQQRYSYMVVGVWVTALATTQCGA